MELYLVNFHKNFNTRETLLIPKLDHFQFHKHPHQNNSFKKSVLLLEDVANLRFHKNIPHESKKYCIFFFTTEETTPETVKQLLICNGIK